MVIETWLEGHTFRCAIGRVTQQQCEALRARPTIAELARRSGSREMPRPRVCEECTEWMRHSQMSDGEKPVEQFKKCRMCGRVKPLDEFWGDSHIRDGKKNICKTCDRDRRRKQKSGGRDVGASTAAVSAPAAAQAATQADGLVLHFGDYPEILEKIKRVAREEFRTPEMQAIWILREWLAQRGDV